MEMIGEIGIGRGMEMMMDVKDISSLKPGALIPHISQSSWDALVASKAVSIVMMGDGYLVGIKADGSHVAVIDRCAKQTFIDVPYADTEEEFLKNAEKAWLAKHGKER